MKDCAFLFLMASLSLATPVTLYFCLSLPQWGFWLFPLCLSSFSLPTLYTLYTYAIPVSYPLCLFVVFLPLPFTTKTRYAFLVSKWLLTLNSDLLLCPLGRGAGFLGAPWGLLSELWTHHIPLPPSLYVLPYSESVIQANIGLSVNLTACSDSRAHSFIISWIFIVPFGSRDKSSSLILICIHHWYALGRVSPRSH